MNEMIVIAAATLIGVAIVAMVALKGWQGWLKYKLRELEAQPQVAPEIEGGAAMGAARIEISDLKERIKKLEAIASGVDL